MLIGAAEAMRAGAGAIRQPDEEAWAVEAEATLRKALGEPSPQPSRTAPNSAQTPPWRPPSQSKGVWPL